MLGWMLHLYAKYSVLSFELFSLFILVYMISIIKLFFLNTVWLCNANLLYVQYELTNKRCRILSPISHVSGTKFKSYFHLQLEKFQRFYLTTDVTPYRLHH